MDLRPPYSGTRADVGGGGLDARWPPPPSLSRVCSQIHPSGSFDEESRLFHVPVRGPPKNMGILFLRTDWTDRSDKIGSNERTHQQNPQLGQPAVIRGKAHHTDTDGEKG